MDGIDVPSYFLCPITLDIMKDPVTLSTGITYDRQSIEKWLFSCKNNNTCPVTKQALQETCDLTPNHTLRRLIQAWCTMNASHGIERIATPKPPIDRTQIAKILRDARSPQLQTKCLQRLKAIASENETNKRAIENAGAVEFLASLVINDPGSLSEARPSEEALSILYSLCMSKSWLKTLVCQNSLFVESLIKLMQRGNYESRTYAVCLLKSMFEVAEPISLRHDFFVEIVRLLGERVSYRALKSMLQLLVNVCPSGRNRVKAVEAGAVPVLIELLLESAVGRVCEMVLHLLDIMCGCAEGRAEFLKHGAGLAIVSKKIFRVSKVASERAVRILYSISKYSATSSVVQEMLQLGAVEKLCLVLQMDRSCKTEEKVKEILRMHGRSWKNSPCMPRSLISLHPS